MCLVMQGTKVYTLFTSKNKKERRSFTSFLSETPPSGLLSHRCNATLRLCRSVLPQQQKRPLPVMRNPRHTFTRSQVIYGCLVDTFEPYPQIYTSTIRLRYYFNSWCQSMSTRNMNYKSYLVVNVRILPSYRL